jgi:cell division protein FtsQ
MPNKSKKTNKKITGANAVIKKILGAAFIAALLCGIVFIFTHHYLFQINNIIINENGKYTYEEIIRASGIVQGRELFGLNIRQAEENIKENLTYTENVRITRIPPSTITIDIKTEDGLFGIMLGGDYYIVSENLRVLEKIKVVGSGTGGFEPPGNIITFKTDAVQKCFIGEKMEFSDNDIYDFLKEMAGFQKNNKENGVMSGMPKITGIDITNKFRVIMNYEDKFLVRFGIFENISDKIINSYEIIERLPGHAEGIIDITDGKTASFRYHENISRLFRADT